LPGEREEGEIERDQLVGVAPPKLDQKVYEPLTDTQVRAMVAACSGLDQFRDRRDEARRTHRLAGTDALWLGDRGKQFSYWGLHKALGMRARRAGISGFHPHILRHTAAHRWLAAGGSEGGLMAVAGWTRPDTLAIYTRARASERAAEEARRLNLGEL